MVLPGFKWELDELRERHGPDLGRRVYEESLEAFEWTASTIATAAYFGGLLVERSGGLHPARYHARERLASPVRLPPDPERSHALVQAQG
jgi:hypothetical protein